MAGIYLHIPFCKQACHYCNFHFSTSLRQKDALLQALHQEIRLQTSYLAQAPVYTVYVGGGTPSLLTISELQALFDILHTYFDLSHVQEVTLEANPDDLTLPYLQALRTTTPVNRLSIGVQSFFEEDLRFMHRAHNAQEAEQCIRRAQEQGFEQLTIDLIYGSPTTTHAHWEANLEKITTFQLPHFSCYCLTVEPRTALHHQVKTGKAPAPDDAHAEQQFATLLAFAERQGYWQYEISNFCLPERVALHNTNYWRGVPYLGLGPSAHSFNGSSRQWNIANNALYIKALQEGVLPCEVEELTPAQRYNEYVMTSLRTQWGADHLFIRATFGDAMATYFLKQVIAPLTAGDVVKLSEHSYAIAKSARFRADGIIADLFFC